MKITRFTTNLFQENCYLLWSEERKDAFVIDSGMMAEDERKCFDDFVLEKGIIIKRVLLTHVHIDHACSAAYVAQKYGCEIYANVEDADLALNLPIQAEAFHLKISVAPLEIKNAVHDGEIMCLADEQIEALAVPGHSKGGMAYYLSESGSVFVGDSVFAGSIGRTDLWGGSFTDLVESVKAKLLTLPQETVIYPGHGPSTTVGEEKMRNPYLQ